MFEHCLQERIVDSVLERAVGDGLNRSLGVSRGNVEPQYPFLLLRLLFIEPQIPISETVAKHDVDASLLRGNDHI